MSKRFIDRLARADIDGPETPLQIQIFRLLCVATFALTGGLVAPMNFVVGLPPLLHLLTALFTALGVVCFLESRRGRHHLVAYFVVAVLLLDVAWFINAGIDGSITCYFVVCWVFLGAVFDGRARWIAAGLVLLDVIALHLLERAFPHWSTPFPSRDNRLYDHVTSLVAASIAVTAVCYVIVSRYRDEQQRLRAVAARLRTSEENYREIFNAASEAIFIHEPDGRLVEVNDRACALFGADRTVLLGRAIGDLSQGQPPFTETEVRDFFRRALAGRPQVFEWRSRRADGTVFWSEIALRSARLGDATRVIAAVRDISERRRADALLRRNEERLRLAMAATAQGWFELNVRTGEGLSSPESARLLGFDPDEFQPNLAAWLAAIHPDDREAAVAEYRRCVASGRTHVIEYRRRTKSGTWKWLRTVGMIVEFDSAGSPLRLCGTHADISRRKEIEAQLLHRQRLEVVGTLASGVAHDLNNILTPIVMASGVLLQKLHDPADRELMKLLDRGGHRGAAIVKQLLAFSRNLAQERVAVDLAVLVREALAALLPSLPAAVTVVGHDDDSGTVQADATQLRQVVADLCANACDAMPGGGTLRLSLSRTDAALHPEEKAPASGRFLVLAVADTGSGIPPSVLPRIFDPFFTTKPGGTGLGLASVHGIVRAHQGFVRVESTLGQGSTFRIYLPELAPAAPAAAAGPAPATPAPASVSPPAAVLASAPAARAPAKSAPILVVDDEPAVLSTLRHLLEHVGYTVLTAPSGAVALRLFAETDSGVGLVLTDFAMPEIDGPTLAQKLRLIAPDLPVIGMSGRDPSTHPDVLRRLGMVEILPKPFEAARLLAAVRRHLPAASRLSEL